MLVGNGLIASAFRSFEADERFIVLAAGVSDSMLDSSSAFEREQRMISRYNGSTARVVYFSTCSIHDPSLAHSPYIFHKKRMEELVRNLYTDHLILRLPNVFGPSGNPNTLFNFLVRQIREGHRFEMHMNATRYILDIEEVQRICGSMIMHSELSKRTFDVVIPPPFSIREIVGSIESVLHLDANFVEVEKGTPYFVEDPDTEQFIPEELLSTEPAIRLERIVQKLLKTIGE